MSFIDTNGIFYNITNSTECSVVSVNNNGISNTNIIIPKIAYNGSTPYDVTMITGVTDQVEPTIVLSVTIPTSVTTIKVFALSDSNKLIKLENVYFDSPSNIQYIEGGAFLNTNLKSIIIPASVTHVYNLVFAGCINLTTVTFLDLTNLINAGYNFSGNIFLESTNLKTIYYNGSSQDYNFLSNYFNTYYSSLNVQIISFNPIISYPNLSNFTVNTPITEINPTVTGTGVLTYSISPTLPNDFLFDTSTGKIIGTPQISQPASTYTITVTNNIGGSAYATISIQINDTQPTINYPDLPNFIVNTPITQIIPTVTGTGLLTYSISPTLPNDFLFDTSTGKITGTPKTSQSASTYTITVSNSIGGSADGTISIQINDTQPTISYPDLPIFLKYIPITEIIPTVTGTGLLIYSISPPLPYYLLFNTTNGKITGTPTNTQISTPYTITLSNSRESVTTTIYILINNITVTFNPANGGTNEEIIYNGISLNPRVITKPGYLFQGWYYDQTGGTQINLSSYIPSYNTVLYAQWNNIIFEVFNTIYTVDENLFKISQSNNKIEINLSDIQQPLDTNLYNSYINNISDTNNPTFQSAINTKNLILKDILSNIIKSNNITNPQSNLDIIINKDLLPSISTRIISTDSIKLISSLSTTIDSLNLVRVQNLFINNEPEYPVMVLMDIDDFIQIVFFGQPVLYVKKKTTNGYEVKELSSNVIITNKQEGVLYEITNISGYIFKYMLGSLLFEFNILPPAKQCVCPTPAIPKQGISFGGNLNIPGHEETQAFRTSYQLINSLYAHGGRTQFYNAQQIRSQKPPPRNTFG